MTRLPSSMPAALLATVLLVAGCAGAAESPSASAEPSTPAESDPGEPSATAEPTEEPSEEPSASASASDSPTPTPIPGDGFTVAPNPAADTLFLDRDECENLRDGYRLQFPDDWYTNTEFRDFPPCVWFSPDFYETTGDAVPPEIAITIEWVPGDVGTFNEILSREEVVVGLQPAVRWELAGAGGAGSEFPPEWREYSYVIQLGPTPEEGPNLVVRTTNEMGGDYDLNRAVMDRMMATIEFVGSVQ